MSANRVRDAGVLREAAAILRQYRKRKTFGLDVVCSVLERTADRLAR